VGLSIHRRGNVRAHRRDSAACRATRHRVVLSVSAYEDA